MLTTFIAVLILAYICGCGADEDEAEMHIPAKFVSASPPAAELAVNSSIILLFDKMPTDLTSSVGTIAVETSSNRGASFEGVRMRLTGPFFPPGPLNIVITWAGGTQKLSYVITAPCADEEDPCG